MKIKHLSFLAAAAVALGLSSCSSDEPVDNNPGNDGENMYARIQLYLPTRSGTDIDDPSQWNGTDNSDDGYEIGLEHENRVNNVILVLATKDETTGKYKKVAISNSSAVPAASADEKYPIFSITFRNDDIQKCADQRVYIFAYCNTDGIISETDEFDPDRVITISSAAPNQGVWKNGSILMVNAPNTIIPSKQLPDLDALQENYNTPEKALDLGTVDVARVVSRFDFKSINNNEYPIYQYVANAEDPDVLDQVEVAKVKLLAMAPLNIAKEFYLLPRVSDDGTDTNWELCGTEYFNINKNVNFVVSPNFTDKNADQLPATLLNKYFYQSTNTDDYSEDFSYTNLSALASAPDDNDQQWYDTELSATDKEGYKIWRYVTENTMPKISSQKKGITTGIIFKAEITEAKEGTPLAEGMKNKRNIYSYNGTIYGDLPTLRSTVYSLAQSNTLRQAFIKVFGEEYLAATKDASGHVIFTVSDEDLVDCNDAVNKDDLTGKRTFKIYRCTDGHYYIYYTYYNRHNDNANSVEMGAMEFSTVRNNIYKLYVSSISDFGYTRPEEDPDDPDEEPKTYLKVSCRVVPWIVRVNKIEF